MKLRIALLFCFLLALSALAFSAEWQNRVERLLWVVGDTAAVAKGWDTIGVHTPGKTESRTLTLNTSGRVSTAKIRWTVSRVGDTIVDFVEPQGGANVFVDFRGRHKDGVMALVHRVGSKADLAAEVARLHGLGVKILAEFQQKDARGEARYVLFDTEAQGKYVLGLIAVSGEYPVALAPPALPANAAHITQYAFAIRDLNSVSAYWEKLGWPAMAVTNPDLLDLEYRGKPEAFAMKLGWYRHTKVPYEWIVSTKEPNVYADHMRVHGEGIHHLAFNVDDMDKAIAEWTGKGFPTSQSGSWGEKGKPGSGRFAYQDTQRVGGIDIELLWNYKTTSTE